MITLLNSPIITSHGNFTYSEVSLEEVKLLMSGGFLSAIGHKTTADVMSVITGYPVEANRILYRQEVGDKAVVFRLEGRPPEGAILTAEEIEDIGYSWGLLERIE
jgi:hypothetical protein